MIRVPLPEYLETMVARLLARFPFFGILACQLPLVEDPEKAGGTASTDGQAIYYCPDFMEKLREQSDDHVVWLLAHEVMHPALGHLWRVPDRSQITRWNVACDAVINRILAACGLPVPGDAILPSRLPGYDQSWEQLSEEEIYLRLPQEEASTIAIAITGQDIIPQDSPQGQGQGGGQADPQGQAQGGGQADPQQQWLDRFLAAAAAAKTQGSLPAEIQRIVDELIKPRIDWRRALAEFITPSRNDYDWRRPDRRLLASCNLYLPTLAGEAIEDVVFAIDTSGSVSEKELAAFLSEVTEALQAYPEVRGWFLSCDADVHAVVQADGRTPREDLVRAIKGGGGTDFRPVFDWVREQGMMPSALVFLTDGMGTYPDQPPPYPVLWVLSPQHQKPPWGKHVVIDLD
jgi:predicted metal-dependent peptidase